MCPIRMGLWHSGIHYPTHGNPFIIVPFTDVKSRQKIEKSFCDNFTSEDKIWDCMDLLSVPYFMNGSRDIWEGPNMRIWTNIRREGKSGENILISLVRTCHGPSQWVLMTLMAYGHYTKTTWSGWQHLWQIRDISSRIRREDIRIKRSLRSHYKTLSITTRVWVVCGTKRACVI